MHPRSSRFLFKALVLAVAYFACAMAARGLRANPAFVPILWLPWGLVIGTLVISERREWLWLLAATVPADWVFNQLGARDAFGSWLNTRAASLVAAWLSAWAIARFRNGSPRLESVRDVIGVYVAGLLAVTIPSVAVAFEKKLTGNPDPYETLFGSWYTLNMLGFAMVVPAMLLWWPLERPQFRSSPRAGLPEIGGVAVLYLLFVSAGHSGGFFSILGAQPGTLALVVWAAIRLGPRGVAAVNAFAIVLGALLPVHVQIGVEDGASISRREMFHSMVYFIVTSFAGMLVAIAIEAQRRAEELLAQKNAALEDALHTKSRQATALRDTNALLQKVLVRSEGLAAELVQTNQALGVSDRAKLEFVRSLSHELRNPIAGARMMADTLLRAPLDEASRRQVSNLRSCVSYLHTLLDESLDLTQVESGQIAVKLEYLTPGEILNEVASLFENMAVERGLHFEARPGANADLGLFGDKTHTKRILINYLSNAFKFTARGSVILEVSAATESEGVCRLRFEVRDTGPGISEALRPRLFSRFVRESSRGGADMMLGAGLGLALCQQLADLAGGSVGYSPETAGGSNFWVELPFIKGSALGGASDDVLADRPDFGHLSVCVIDDEPLQLEVMSSVLEQFGVTPKTAQTPAAALELLNKHRFDLVLMDYHIAGDTGINLLQRAKEQCESFPSTTRVHLFTALWDESLAQRAVEAGFHGSHRKPISLVSLHGLLQGAQAGRVDSSHRG